MNDYLAFNTLAFRWMETMAASGQVIAHRTMRANSPLQLHEMVAEKAVATAQASQAVSRRMARMGQVAPPAMFGEWVRLVSSALAPYHAGAVRNARRSRSRTL